MFGPVLYLEMLLGGRRGRQYIFRWIYAGWLIAQLLFYYSMYRIDYMASGWSINGESHPDPSATGRFAGGFVEMFVVQQFLLVLLATPAFTAGAITDEKTRGTLQHLLIAHLTAGEIVLGKLLGRLAQVGVLVLVGLPVLCFIGVFGGLDPLLMLAVLAATVVPLFASEQRASWRQSGAGGREMRSSSCTRSAAAAGCCCGPCRDLAAWLVSRLPPGVGVGRATGIGDRPRRCAASLQSAGGTGAGLDLGLDGRGRCTLIYLLLAWGSVGVGCLLLATWRLRPAYVHQLESTGRKSRKKEVLHRPPVDNEDPVRWREQHVGGVAPIPIFAASRRSPAWSFTASLPWLPHWASWRRAFRQIGR